MSYLTGDPIGVRIRIAFGANIAANPATWVWTDVTAWWHVPDDVTIGWGRSSGAEQAERSTLSLTLKNTDGRFTAYDARSPYWPHVRKWTPIEYDIDLGDGASWRNRFSGFLRKLPLTWPGASPFMALAKIEAVGVLGRLGRGKPPARSAMQRAIVSTGPVAYWPIEDGTDAGQLASALPGHQALRYTGPAPTVATIESWTAERGYEVRYGTQALADLAAGTSLSASAPPAVTAATASGWTAAIVADMTVGSALSGSVAPIDIWTPGGTYARWQYVITTTGRTQVIAYDVDMNFTIVVDSPTVRASLDLHNFAVWQDAGTIRVGLEWGGSSYRATGSIAGTLTGIGSVGVNPSRATVTVPMPVGHLAVWAGHDLPAVARLDGRVISALFGYGWSGLGTASAAATGERATLRLARLAAEDGIALTVPAVDPADEVMMGYQQPGTPLALYQECESADQGLIYESGFGLGYLPRAARYNAPLALTIDAAAGQLGMPFEPVDDDQTLRNRWTVSRVDGSSAVAVDEQSIDTQGVIEGSDAVNLVTDDPLADHASWRLRLSTVQEPRYQAVSINLAAHPELAAAWCACKSGSRVQVVNPPRQNVPGAVDQLVVGATETYRGRRSWKATLNVVPASPWQVAVADGEQRVAADGSVTAGLTASGTSMLLSSTPENGTWTEDPADFPLDIRVGGERATASAIARSFSDTYTRTVAAGGWGAPWQVNSGAPSAFSVDGSQGVIAVSGVGLEHHVTYDVTTRTQDLRLWYTLPVVPTGAPVNVGILLRYTDPNNYIWADAQVGTDSSITLRLIKRVGGVVTQLATGPSGVAHSTSAPRAIRAEVNGSLVRVRLWVATDSKPSTWGLSVVDAALPTGTRAGAIARLMTGNTNGTVSVRIDNVSTAQPQLVTLAARGVNGVQRVWPDGTEVDVWQPAILAL